MVYRLHKQAVGKTTDADLGARTHRLARIDRAQGGGEQRANDPEHTQMGIHVDVVLRSASCPLRWIMRGFRER